MTTETPNLPPGVENAGLAVNGKPLRGKFEGSGASLKPPGVENAGLEVNGKPLRGKFEGSGASLKPPGVENAGLEVNGKPLRGKFEGSGASLKPLHFLWRGGRRPGWAWRRGGFTFVECVVICFILVVLAAAIVPNLRTLWQAQQARELEQTVARLPMLAKNEAVHDQMEVRLRIDGTHLIMEKVDSDGVATQVKDVDLGNNLNIVSCQLNYQNSDAGTWQWTAYPDGTAENGAIQFAEGSRQRGLEIADSGQAHWIDGTLPDETLDQWPAGQLDIQNAAVTTQ